MNLLNTYLKKVYEENMGGGLAPANTSNEFTSGKGAGAKIVAQIEFAVANKSITVNYNGNSMPLQNFINTPATAAIWKIIKPKFAEGASDDASAIEYINNEFASNKQPFDVIVNSEGKVTINRETQGAI